MPNKHQILRSKAYRQQNGYCYYCNMPMWDKSPEPLALQYHVPTNRINPLKCTAEHLDARRDGGKDSGDNIVAACHFCNSQRHKYKIAKEPESYKSKVQTRMRKKGWTTKLIPSYQWRKIEFGQKKDITSNDVASD